MFVFGPVPSRRLGQSLGVNNIQAPKECSYDCVYCQVGPTPQQSVRRRTFYSPELIAAEVEQKLAECREAGAPVDYVTFVPDGEPTLDVNLGRANELIRPLGCKIAVITNGTLIDRKEVREELHGVDWISLKVESAEEGDWRTINRPHPDLQLNTILDGMRTFANEFEGTLTTETLLVAGVNDSAQSIEAIGDILVELQPDVAYLAAPTRPPAERWVRAPEEEVLHRAYQILAGKLDKLEYLLGFAEDPFRATTDPAQAILSITAVHPMREEEALHYIAQMGAGLEVLDQLVVSGQMARVHYQDQPFYVRRLPGRGV